MGAIPPSAKKDVLDGVSVRKVISTRVLSFATVRTFHFGKGVEGDAAIRALILAVLLRDIAGYDENFAKRYEEDQEKPVKTVMIDSKGSFANRAEETTTEAMRNGEGVLSKMPRIAVQYDTDAGKEVVYDNPLAQTEGKARYLSSAARKQREVLKAPWVMALYLEINAIACNGDISVVRSILDNCEIPFRYT